MYMKQVICKKSIFQKSFHIHFYTQWHISGAGFSNKKKHTRAAFNQNQHSTYYGNRNNSNNPMRERGFCLFFLLLLFGMKCEYLVDETKKNRQIRNSILYDVKKKIGRMENVKRKDSNEIREREASKTRQYKERKRSTITKRKNSSNRNRVAIVTAFCELKYFGSSSFFNVYSLTEA